MNVQQRALANRALQLLDLPANVPALLLDAGCGTGYSGRPLEKAGHTWLGTDISLNMLRSGVAAATGAGSSDDPRSARTRRFPQVICDDLGRGLAFRNGIFDGCVSISAVQWLCHSTNPQHDPERRVKKFFTALRAVLVGGARAVLQLYPEQPEHMAMLRDAAVECGFSGGLVVDYPWSERSKKLFLVLVAPKREEAQQTWMGELLPREGGGKSKAKAREASAGGEGGGGDGDLALGNDSSALHSARGDAGSRERGGKGGKGGGGNGGKGGKGGGGKGGKGGKGGGGKGKRKGGPDGGKGADGKKARRE